MAKRGGAAGSAGRVGGIRAIGEGEPKPKRKWRPPPKPDRQAQRLAAREPTICPHCHMAEPCGCPESEMD